MSELRHRNKLANAPTTNGVGDAERKPGDDLLSDPLLAAALALPEPTLDPDPPDDPGDAAAKVVDKRMSRSLFDWRITDEEATSSLDDLLALDVAALDAALAKLGASGKLKRLFEQLPPEVHREHPDKMMVLYQHAPPAILKARVADLLSLGVFDWAINAGDVQQVLDLLAVLPKAARDELMLADDGKLYNSLMASNGKEAAEAEITARKEAEAALAAEEQRKAQSRGPGAFPMADGHLDVTSGLDDGAPVGAQGDGGEAKKGGFFNKVGKGLGKAAAVTNTVAQVPAKVVQGGFIAGRALFAHKIDLDHVEALMGGDVAGVAFDKQQGNDLSFTTDWDRGLLTVDLPSLGIESVSMDGVSSGKSSIRGLKGEVKYRTRKDTDNHVKLKVDAVELGDTEVAMGGSTWTIEGLAIHGVDITAVDPPVTQARPLDRGDGLKLVFNQVKDAIGLNLPAIKAALGGGGPTPETLMEHVAKGLGADADLAIKVAGIDLGAVKRDGQAVAAGVDVDGLSLTTRDISLKPRLEAELAKLDGLQQPDPATLKRKSELQGLLAGWDDQEQRFAELQGLATRGALTPAQEDELITLRNTLRVAEAHLTIDAIHTDKVAMGGNGVDALTATGVDLTASGGPLESSKRLKTRGQKLDDLVALKHNGAETGAALPVPGLQVAGTVGTYDVDGAKVDPGEYGQVAVSADGTGLGLSYDEASGDVGLTSKTFAVDGLDYGKGASKDYAAYATTLDHAQGEALDFAYNLNSGATSGSAQNVSGAGLAMPGMDTEVGAFAAGGAAFTMNEAGDVSADLTCAHASDVSYLAPGSETELDVVSADTFHVDMFDRTLDDGSTSSTLQGSGTGVHAEGVSYHPNDVEVGRVDAATAGFSMVDVARQDGSTSSTILADLSGVDASGVDYLAAGNETHVGEAKAKDLHVTMQTDAANGASRSTTDVTGTGVDVGGVKYAPSDVAVDTGHADTFGVHMLDVTDGGVTTSTIWGEGTGVRAGGVDYAAGTPGAVHVDGVDAKAANFTVADDGTVLAGGDGVHASGVDYAAGTSGAVHVGDVKARTGTFAMGPDGAMSAKGKGVKAKDVRYGQEGSADYVTVGSATAGTASYSATADGDMKVGVGGLDLHRVTRGVEGDDRLEVDHASTAHLGLSSTADGTTVVSAPALNAQGVRYGDTDHGKGTTVGAATLDDLKVVNAGGVTTVDASHVGATDIYNGDAGVKVGGASLNTVKLTSGDDLHVTADDYQLDDLAYTDPASTTPDQADVTAKTAFGTKLDLRNGDAGLDVTSETLGATDLRYGSFAPGKTGVAADWAGVQGFGLHHDADGLDVDADEVTVGSTVAKTGDRVTTVGGASLFDVNARDMNFGGPGTFSGSLDVGSFNAQGIVSAEGGEVVQVGDTWGTGVYAYGDGDNKLNAGMTSLHANDLSYFDGTSGASVKSADVQGLDATVGGLDASPTLDGLSAQSVDLTDAKGGVALWRLLDQKSKPKTAAGGDDANDEVKPVKADAMRTASGTFRAKVPVNVKIFGVGVIGLDVNITAVAKNGQVNLNAVRIDVVPTSFGGAYAKALAERVLLSPIEPKLAADSDGNLELQFEVVGIPVFVNLVKMKDMGVSGGWFAPNVLSLEGLVKGLLTPKPAKKVDGGGGLPFLPTAGTQGATTGAQPASTTPQDTPQLDLPPIAAQPVARDATYVDPSYLGYPGVTVEPRTTTETVAAAIEDADTWVDVGRASVDISGLKLGDGAIGNDKFGMTLYGASGGANQVNGDFTAGAGGGVTVNKLRAKDAYVGDDVQVGDLQVDGLVAGGQNIVGKDRKLNRNQVVGGGFKHAKVSKVQVGGAPAGRRKAP